MAENYQIILVFLFLIGILVYRNFIPKNEIIEALNDFMDDDNSTIIQLHRLGLTETLKYSSISEMFSFLVFISYNFYYDPKRYIYRKAEIKNHLDTSALVYFRLKIKLKTIKEIEIVDSYEF